MSGAARCPCCEEVIGAGGTGRVTVVANFRSAQTVASARLCALCARAFLVDLCKPRSRLRLEFLAFPLKELRPSRAFGPGDADNPFAGSAGNGGD